MTKVLGIGNALVDVMTLLPNDDLLHSLSFPKGSMQLIDEHTLRELTGKISSFRQSCSSGGSAANTIHGLACLGIETGFIGSVGRDEFGEIFRKDLMDNNIEPHLVYGKKETGRAIALVSPDSERTFGTFLGAAIELSSVHLEKTTFDKYRYFHVEGYLVQNRSLLEEALVLAKSSGLTISLDMASFNVVTANRDFLEHILKEYVNIIFANEEEAKSFTGKNPEESLAHLSELCEIAVVKIGKDGSLIKRSVETARVGIIPVNPVDTTGAGDLYASGFLFGLMNGLSLEKSGEIGALLGGRVIEIVGSKMQKEKWGDLRLAAKAML